MTEQLFPDDMANGLVDGTLPPAAVPADLQRTAGLLRAAHQPATAGELQGMAAMVQQFTAATVAAAPITSSRSSMFATRLTRRTVGVVAITLLAAGTAAASAGGVLPSPFGSNTEVVDTTLPGDTLPETTLAPDTTVGGSTVDTTVVTTLVDTTAAEGATTSSVDDEANDDGANDDSHDSHLFGKCTAWTNGGQKNAANPAFAELQANADAEGLTIDEYCLAVIAAHDADENESDHDSADESDDDSGDHESDDDQSDDDESDDDHGGGNSGGNHGGGNSGGDHGGGNSGGGNSGGGNHGGGGDDQGNDD